MDSKVYTVTCLKCKDSSRIRFFSNNSVLYIDHTPIIACRFRGDLKFGFECQCGNDSRLCKEEKEQVSVLVQGGKHAIEKIVNGLKVKDENKFRMVLA